MTISDESGKQVRRFDVARGAGLRRVAWNLRADPPPATDRSGGPAGAGRLREDASASLAGARGDNERAQAGGGRGPQQGPLVTPGRYRAQLGKQVGNDVTSPGSA